MDFTGSLRAEYGHSGAKAQTPHMSYEHRAGQVERLLETVSEVKIYDLAKLLNMSHRRMHTICQRMYQESRIAVRQVPHRKNINKHLISRRQP